MLEYSSRNTLTNFRIFPIFLELFVNYLPQLSGLNSVGILFWYVSVNYLKCSLCLIIWRLKEDFHLLVIWWIIKLKSLEFSFRDFTAWSVWFYSWGPDEVRLGFHRSLVCVLLHCVCETSHICHFFGPETFYWILNLGLVFSFSCRLLDDSSKEQAWIRVMQNTRWT